MKKIIKNIMTIAALLLTVSVARAANEVKVVPSTDGTVTASVAGTTCTLTLTPASGYYITAEHIKVVKVVDGGEAQSRRTPDVDDTVISVTPTDATADPSGVTIYTFTMPGGDYDAEVTATFQQRVDISSATVTVADGPYVYNGQPHEAAVTSVVLGSQPLTASDYSVTYANNTHAGQATVVVTGQRTFMGEVTSSFTIDKAPVTITFAEPEVTVNVNDQAQYQQQPTVSLAGATLEWSTSDSYIASLLDDGLVALDGYGVVEITAAFAGNDDYQPAADSYRLTVKNSFPLTVYDVEVTSDNRKNILGDGSAMFDGRGTLIIDNLSSGVASIVSHLPSLTIFLKGDNILSKIEGQGSLTFTTEGNNPGKLTLQHSAPLENLKFTTVTYDQNLAPLSGDGGYIVIGTPVKPITQNADQPVTVNVAEAVTAEQSALTNTVIADVLYTLPDAIEEVVQNDHIELSYIYVESDVDASVYQPGTTEYAKEFAGLTFMVPAGTGKIIINAKTGEEGVLKVKIGDEEPLIIVHLLDFTEVEIPYACPEATYVCVYNGSKLAESGSRHASKKTHITVGIRTVGVTAESLQTSNEMSKSVESQAQSANIGKVVDSEKIGSEVEQSNETMTIDNHEVVSLADDAFSSLLGQFIGSVDLRSSNVMGLTVNRSEGAFNGLSENCFIYLPTGNKAAEGEVNVVFGGICPVAVLNVDMPSDESFAPASEFIAQQIELNRPYSDGEMSTVYLPFSIDYATAAQLGTFYTVGEVKNGYVKIDEVTSGTLTAHTPYLFRAATDKIRMRVVQVTPPPAEARRFAPADSDDGLHGCYKTTTSTTAYKLTGTNLSDLRFERMTGSDVVRPFEAYLTLSGETATSLQVTDDEGIVTGIKSVTPSQVGDTPLYNLAGQMLDSKSVKDQLPRGIYIKNGKKIVVGN